MKNKSLGIINVIMPRSTHDSISSYYSQKERYYAHNVQTLKKEKPAQRPRKSYKKQMEGSRLLFVAKGGQCLILGLIYPFYLVLYAFPSWIGINILPKSVRFIRGVLSKFTSLVASPFLKGYRFACSLAEKIIATVFIRPFEALKKGVISLKKKFSFSPSRLFNGVKLEKLSEFPKRIGTSLVQKGIVFKKGVLNLVFSPVNTFIRLKNQISQGMKKIGDWISKIANRILKLKGLFTFSFKLKPFSIKKKLIFKVKWPKIKLPKWKGIQMPTFPKVPKFKTPRVLDRVKNFRIPKLFPAFTLSMPKVKFDGFLKLIPKRRFSLGPWKFLTFRPLYPLLRRGKFFLLSVAKWVNVPLSWVFGFLLKAIQMIGRIFSLIINGLSLLMGYWNEQVKEWMAKKLEG